MSKSVMLAAGEDLLVAPSRTTSSGVVLSQPGILALGDVMEWSGQTGLLLCVVTRLETVDELTGVICADAPGTLCYGSMCAAGGDESSQDNRGEHDGIFLVSVGLLNLCNLSDGDPRAQRPCPVLPGVHMFIVLEGRQGRNARCPLPSKRN